MANKIVITKDITTVQNLPISGNALGVVDGELAQGEVNFQVNGIVEQGNTNAVSGGEVYEAINTIDLSISNLNESSGPAEPSTIYFNRYELFNTSILINSLTVYGKGVIKIYKASDSMNDIIEIGQVNNGSSDALITHDVNFQLEPNKRIGVSGQLRYRFNTTGEVQFWGSDTNAWSNVLNLNYGYNIYYDRKLILEKISDINEVSFQYENKLNNISQYAGSTDLFSVIYFNEYKTFDFETTLSKIKVSGKGVISIYKANKNKYFTDLVKIGEVNNGASYAVVEHIVNFNLASGDRIGISGDIRYRFNSSSNSKLMRFWGSDTNTWGNALLLNYEYTLTSNIINPVNDLVNDSNLLDLNIKPKLFKYEDRNNINTNLPNFAYFIGKWWAENGEARTISQGSEFHFRKNGGNSVTLNLINNSTAPRKVFICVSVNGGSWTRYECTFPTLNIGDSLPSDCYIRVVIDGLDEHDDKWVGGKGFAISGATSNGTITPAFPRNKKILFIGDSITEGINVRGTGAIPLNNSGALSFPAIACRELNSISLRNGYGGSGVTVGGSGGIPKAIDTINWAKQGIPLIMDEPDLIIINQGTNDTNLTLYITDYNALLNALRIKYSGTPIFIIVPFNQTKLIQLINIANNNQDVYLIETEGWGVTYTDNAHPDIAGGETAGVKLARVITEQIGKSFFY